MPDHFDRARLATVGVLAGFALLALAFVMHLAGSTVPLPLGGDAGQGQVLTTSGRASGAHGGSGGQSTAPDAQGAGKRAATSSRGGNAGSESAGSNGQAGAGGAPHSDAPASKQVD